MKILSKSSCIAFISLVFALFGCVFYVQAGQSVAQQSFINTYNDEPITIAINESSFPYHFVDSKGQAAGLMPDLWRLWAKKQQVSIKFVTLPWLETLEQVKNGDVDIHAGLSIIDSRKSYLAFSQPIFPLYTHIYVNGELLDVNRLEDLTPFAIGVVDGSAHIDMLSKNFPQLEHKRYPKRHALYEAALKKEVLVFTGLEKLANNYQHYKQLNAMYPPYKRLRYQQGNYGAAVAKANQGLLDFIEEGMAKISLTERAKIERMWLAVDKKKDSLLIAFPPDYPPYAALSPAGQPQGLLVDMWRLWAKQTDTNITFVARTMKDSLSLIKSNNIDALIGYPSAWLDKDNFSLAEPIYQSKAKVFVSNKTPDIKSIDYFAQAKNNGKLGIWKKTPFKQQLQAQYPKIALQVYDSVSAMLKAAELGEIDAFIGHVDFMALKLLKANLQSYFYTPDLVVFNSTISPLVNKGNNRLRHFIDEGFKQIPLSQLASLEERWLIGGNLYYQSLLKKVMLTQEEKEFIAKNTVIDVGFLKFLAPTEFVNEQGEFAGIDRDILNLITERTGLTFNFISYDSWYSLYQAMLAGDIDLITSITPTKERQEKFLFSEDYWQTPWAILHSQYIGRQSKLNYFYGKKLAIVKGYYLVDYFRENHPLITMSVVNDRGEGLKLLQQGKVEGVIATISSASQLLKHESLISLMISVIDGVPVDKSHFGINKEKAPLQSILNKGLLSISSEEKNQIHDKWFSV
ncbi:MAG: transporter substrate-binding domain-containing protein, partial [Colwellia sp.]|nr:transporter substrate-binding domain-containing protein [Colwellia sp.]